MCHTPQVFDCLFFSYLHVKLPIGLTLITGHLLLLAPEEDAFWIFVSMMEHVLRPYFSPASTQMEVDAALFSRALEANDPQTAKKVLTDMSIDPTHICSPWYVECRLVRSYLNGPSPGFPPYSSNVYRLITPTGFGTSSYMKVR